MTTLMKNLIERLKAIPEDKQDDYAATYLTELEDDQRWEELFANTTDEQWKKLADQARAEMESGETRPLSDLTKNRS